MLLARRRGADALLQFVKVFLIGAQDGHVRLTGRVCVQDKRGVECEHSPQRRSQGRQVGRVGDERQRPLGCITRKERAEVGDENCQVVRLMSSFDIVFWPRLILGNGPPVVRARPTLPTSNGRLEVGCAGEERRWICSRSYAANTSSG